MPVRPAIYAPFRLTADLSSLSPEERRMLGLFIDAAQIMDGLFWRQAYGDRDQLLNGIEDLARDSSPIINYGPWDRLEDNRPFVPGVGAKPEGAAFYPPDMSREEFERAQLPGKDSLYTFVTRDPNGALALVPYDVGFAAELRQAATLLTQAAALAARPGLRNYLELRADALTSDDYRASDMAWMDMKDNRIDLVIGPIETYEDQLFGYKAAYEAYVLVKDIEWSERLARYAAFLPDLQRGLPVPDAYKAEAAGSDSDLNAYDVIYYAGDCNAGAKTIAINLPNDEQVQLAKGTRRLQLKNAMRAKFDEDPGADRSGADRGGPAAAHHLRCLLRRHDVPRGGARARHQEHDQRQGHGARGAQGSRRRARGRQGGRARSLHDHEAPRARRARGPASRTTTSPSSRASSARCASAPHPRTARRTWCASTISPSTAPSRAIRRADATASTCARMRQAIDGLSAADPAAAGRRRLRSGARG